MVNLMPCFMLALAYALYIGFIWIICVIDSLCICIGCDLIELCLE